MPIHDVTEKRIADLLNMSGRGVVVTGPGAGIGKAVARRLAEAGARIMIAVIDKTAADTAAASLFGTGHMAQRVDLTDPDSVSAAAEADPLAPRVIAGRRCGR